MKLAGATIGNRQPLFLIAGPCVIETEEMVLEVARQLAAIAARLGIPYVFKASFDKANRTSGTAPRGPGLVEGLRILARLECPVTPFGRRVGTEGGRGIIG